MPPVAAAVGGKIRAPVEEGIDDDGTPQSQLPQFHHGAALLLCGRARLQLPLQTVIVCPSTPVGCWPGFWSRVTLLQGAGGEGGWREPATERPEVWPALPCPPLPAFCTTLGAHLPAAALPTHTCR